MPHDYSLNDMYWALAAGALIGWFVGSCVEIYRIHKKCDYLQQLKHLLYRLGHYFVGERQTMQYTVEHLKMGHRIWPAYTRRIRVPKSRFMLLLVVGEKRKK